MKYLQKVLNLPSKLAENVLYYATEDNKVAIKPKEKPIEYDSKTIVFYADGTQKEYDIVGTINNSGITGRTTQIGDWENGYAIKFGNTVTSLKAGSIGGYYFYPPTDQTTRNNIATVYIPTSITSIGASAFQNDDLLSDIYYEGTKEQWDTIAKGSNWNQTTNYKQTVHCSDGDIVLADYDEDKLTKVWYTDGDYREFYIEGEIFGAFPNWGEHPTFQITEVKSANKVIINPINSIGSYAFYYCTRLTSVNSTNEGECNIPNSVTNIGDRAFVGCDGLTSVTIPNSVTEIGWRAFNACAKLASVTYNGTTYTSKSALVFATCCLSADL